jgi:hypothetical protein
MLEDLDTISQPILDAILEHLVEPAKTEKPAAYSLARRILQRCASELHDPLYHFLQSCLPSAVVPVIESDLRDEWPRLIVEVRCRQYQPVRRYCTVPRCTCYREISPDCLPALTCLLPAEDATPCLVNEESLCYDDVPLFDAASLCPLADLPSSCR